jgi:LysM repeat protein
MITSDDAQDPPSRRGWLWWLVPVGLVALLLLAGLVTVASLRGVDKSKSEATAAAATRKLPPYWVVKRGQTYSQIAQRTGLTMDQLQTFNPRTDPTSIVPGQRIKLRLRMPAPPPKRLGPQFWTVRSGQSFGSIAAKTGRPIDELRRLNPKLEPEALMPGDRVRLRR